MNRAAILFVLAIAFAPSASFAGWWNPFGGSQPATQGQEQKTPTNPGGTKVITPPGTPASGTTQQTINDKYLYDYAPSETVTYGRENEAYQISSTLASDHPIAVVIGSVDAGKSATIDTYVRAQEATNPVGLQHGYKYKVLDTNGIMLDPNPGQAFRWTMTWIANENARNPTAPYALIIPSGLEIQNFAEVLEAAIVAPPSVQTPKGKVVRMQIPMIVEAPDKSTVLAAFSKIAGRYRGITLANLSLESVSMALSKYAQTEMDQFQTEKKFKVPYTEELNAEIAKIATIYKSDTAVASGERMIRRLFQEYYNEVVQGQGKIQRWRTEMAKLQSERDNYNYYHQNPTGPDQQVVSDKLAQYDNAIATLKSLADNSQTIDQAKADLAKVSKQITDLQASLGVLQNTKAPNSGELGSLNPAINSGGSANGQSGGNTAPNVQARISQLQAKQDALNKAVAAENPTGVPTDITKKLVYQIAAQETGLPESIFSKDTEKLLESLEDALGNRIIGQDRVLKSVSDFTRVFYRNALARQAYMLAHPPTAADAAKPAPPANFQAFLFVGKSGGGKTELFRQIAEHLGMPFLYEGMSKMNQSISVNQVVGAPPAYVGFKDPNTLWAKLKALPKWAVMLLDELDKAHQDVKKILIDWLDKGVAQNSAGEEATLDGKIVGITINEGSDFMDIINEIKSLTGKTDQASVAKRNLDLARLGLDEAAFGKLTAAKGDDYDTLLEQAVKSYLRTSYGTQYPPELLNRVKVVLFDNLPLEALNPILKIFVKQFEDETWDFSFTKVYVTDQAFTQMLKLYDPEGQGRSLRDIAKAKLTATFQKLRGINPETQAAVIVYDKASGNFQAYAGDKNDLSTFAEQFRTSQAAMATESTGGRLGKESAFDPELIEQEKIAEIIKDSPK